MMLSSSLFPPSSSHTENGSEKLVEEEEDRTGWNFLRYARNSLMHEVRLVWIQAVKHITPLKKAAGPSCTHVLPMTSASPLA
eukprot:758684-Hanusia_phi.AAC.7